MLGTWRHHLDQSILFTQPSILAGEIKAELVIIATTAPSHCQLTTLFAENGAKYILCEKPMAVSLSECEKMIAICRSNGTSLAINHQRRFMNRVILPREIISRDSFGELASIIQVGGNMGMAMNAIHSFELFRYLIEDNADEVTAWFSNEPIPLFTVVTAGFCKTFFR